MAQQDIIIGAEDAKAGDTQFTAWTKAQANFTELYGCTPANVVTVNAIEDFPTQDATTITLENDTQYFIGAVITTSKRFVVQTGASLVSIGPFSVALVYTGGGTMFTSTVSWELSRIGVSATGGKLFEFSGVGATVLINDFVCVSAAETGTITDASLVLSNSGVFGLTGQGLTFAGAINILSIEKYRQVSSFASHVGIDLGTATFNDIEVADYEPSGPVGSVAISGLVSSGNILANKKAVVINSTLNNDGMIPLANIQVNDIRWAFAGNSGLSNSRNAGDMYLSGGTEEITVSVAGDFYEIGTPVTATWVGDIADRFLVDAAGYLEYIGESELDCQISGRATVEKVGGGSEVIEARLAKNWTAGSTGEEKTQAGTQNTDPTTIPVGGLISLASGDNIRMIFANNGSTANILAAVTSIEITG